MFIEYTYLVPLIPMLCFLIIGLAGRKTPQKGGYIAIAGALISFIIAALISYEYLTGDQYPNAVTQSIEWFSIGDITMHLGYYVDGLTCMMMLFSSFISTLIFVYSIGYMGEEGPRRTRPTCSSDSGPSGTTMETLPPPTRHPQPRRPSWSPVSETCA